MKKYGLYLSLMIAFGSPAASFCVEATSEAHYTIPSLDDARIASKKEHYDRKYTRLAYARYATMAAAAAGLAYYGYGKWTAPTPPAINLSIPTVDTLPEAVAKLQQQVGIVQHDLNTVSGKGLLCWARDVANTTLFAINLNTIVKVAFTPVVGRFFAPLFDLDAFWYQVQSEPDLIKGIVNKARRIGIERVLSPNPDEDANYLCRSIQDAAGFLKKQVEEVLAFVAHMQDEYRELSPAIVSQMDDQARYLKACYNDFAAKTEALLNDKNADLATRSSSLATVADQFGQDYAAVKDYLKVLEANALKSQSAPQNSQDNNAP